MMHLPSQKRKVRVCVKFTRRNGETVNKRQRKRFDIGSSL